MNSASGTSQQRDAYPDGPANKRVTYYYDADVGNYAYTDNPATGTHVMKPHRVRMAHNLITNYGLLDHMDVLRPEKATRQQLTRFHTDEYIDFLASVTGDTHGKLSGSGRRNTVEQEWVGSDCPAFEGVYEFSSISAGGSICGAERLNSGAAEIAINWAGGLHHAKKRGASGFCYVNDNVLAILELLRFHPRVLYIDIDVHHGDGVEEAFYTSDRVMTCSFHQFDGWDFFPGTGDVKDVGFGKGKNYAVNVPLRAGITDEAYRSIFEPVIQHIMDFFRPGAVVLQCGADSLAGDKLGSLNLSMKGHASCVKFMKKFDVPLLVLGGGGYTTKNVARTWTYETGLLCGKELDENLPYNYYLEYFGPAYKLDVPASNMDNSNSPQYLNSIREQVLEKLRQVNHAPSIAMHHVPRTSVGAHLGFRDDPDYESDTDIEIAETLFRLQKGHFKPPGRGSDSEAAESDDDGGCHSHGGSAAQQSAAAKKRALAAAMRKGVLPGSARVGEKIASTIAGKKGAGVRTANSSGTTSVGEDGAAGGGGMEGIESSLPPPRRFFRVPAGLPPLAF